MLKKIKTNHCALVIWVFLSCAVHIVLFKAKTNFDYPVWQRLLITLIVVWFTLFIHELVHFIFAKLFSKSEVKIKFAKDPLGLPSMGVFFCQDEMAKWQRIVTYLAPFMALTALVDIVFVFCSEIEFPFLIIPLCNLAGCFYDICDAGIIAKEQ